MPKIMKKFTKFVKVTAKILSVPFWDTVFNAVPTAWVVFEVIFEELQGGPKDRTVCEIK